MAAIKPADAAPLTTSRRPRSVVELFLVCIRLPFAVGVAAAVGIARLLPSRRDYNKSRHFKIYASGFHRDLCGTVVYEDMQFGVGLRSLALICAAAFWSPPIFSVPVALNLLLQCFAARSCRRFPIEVKVKVILRRL